MLRPWHQGGGPRLVETAGDPLFRAAQPNSPLPTDLSEVPAYLLRVRERMADDVRVAWCVAGRDTDLALGGVALQGVDGDTAQVGYWAHPQGRGRGLMNEAVRAVADHAFRSAPEGLGLRRLFLLTAVTNAASQRLAEGAGFTPVGTARAAAATAEGAWVDDLLYDRLCDDPS